jgi:hypothetical protein
MTWLQHCLGSPLAVSRSLTLPLLFLLIPACQKRDYSLDDQRIKPSQFRVILVPTRPTEQKVTVEIRSSGGPIDAYLMPDADQSAAHRAAGLATATRQPPADRLAGQQNATQAKLEAVIPADKACCVMLCNPYPREAVVKVTIQGQ